MNRKFLILIIAVALSFALASCNNDDDDTTSESLSGTLTFSVQTYLPKNEVITLTPEGITSPSNVGYFWKNSWDNVNDTTKTEDGSGDGSWAMLTGSVVGEYTITCYAFASGYSNSYSTKTVYIVDPSIDSTISGLDLAARTHFKDTRDSKTYYTINAGGEYWTANNLGYSGSGISYLNCEVMDEIFGRYYTWEEAQNACPAGWHLPSNQEFAALADSLAGDSAAFQADDDFKVIAGDMMANAYFMGSRMWEYWPQVNITNKSGFAAIPVGYVNNGNTAYTYIGVNSYAVFWTSDEDGDSGFARYIHVESPDMYLGKLNKNILASVRCVKD